ncbi:MAG: hypothetical protein KC464_33990, partial [Myxococcales bacterium]|nr:hypothetical protein [Myxococcales bacterium]
MRLWLVALAFVIAAPRVVSAHPAPAVDANNRYVKLSPMGDRVRVAYTIYLGEIPGNLGRKGIDRDQDGEVSDAEAMTWGKGFAAELGRQLEVELDGVAAPVTWTDVVPGMGSPSVDAGAFSLDLITWICAPKVGGRHQLDLVDHYALLPAGEAELRVEPSPGVRLDVMRVGNGPMEERLVRFDGDAAPLSRGLHVVWVAGPDAEAPADGWCPRPPAGSDEDR